MECFEKVSNGLSYCNPNSIYDPTVNAYSHSVSTNGSGDIVFVSGQSGGEGLNHKLSDSFETQVQEALKNLLLVLGSQDLKPDDVAKITVLIVDHDLEKLKIWTREALKVWSKDKLPASTLIPIPRLALDGMLIEVDAVAFKRR
ncbi:MULTISPECIES: RidA family protein [unclassified Francisella]|uniref:RidA family protein n=1 Tax=unclassified Francisella TaxID=2610885 RepID=UPI002E381DF2|nr:MULTISPECIES: Rid family hydrolase [unclassified Francisella]MED7819642.1 Rid family hydrolase [Francisella sp. 19S2-4]MED7830462.1 Rid family hydrolase [Francisella sp. 19S2-10]